MTSQEITARAEEKQLESFEKCGKDVMEAVKISRCASYVLERYDNDCAKDPTLVFELWVREHFALDKVVECQSVVPDDPGVLIDGPELPRIDGIATDEGLGIAPIHANR